MNIVEHLKTYYALKYVNYDLHIPSTFIVSLPRLPLGMHRGKEFLITKSKPDINVFIVLVYFYNITSTKLL